MRKVLKIAATAILAIAAFMVLRTFQYGPPELPAPPPPVEIALDIDGAAERLSSGLRIRTVSVAGAPTDARAFRDLADLLATAFPMVHRAMTREVIAEHSLLYRWQGSDPDLLPVLLSAHMDVVPADPATLTAWTHPPFSGRIANGMVWGRGALDMKQALFAMMEAAEALLASGHEPRRTILFAFTHDEELDSTGAAAIARTLSERGVRVHMTLDEGLMVTEGIVPGVTAPVALIGVAQKGYLTIELSARGTGGHSSMPPATTAVSRLAAAVTALALDPPASRLQAPVSEMFAALGPELPLGQRFAMANGWLLEPVILSILSESPASGALIRTTIAPTMLSGGIAENVLPQVATATINYRLLPGDTAEQVVADARRRIGDPGIEIRVVGEAAEASGISDLWSPAARPLVDAARAVFPDAVVAPGLGVAISDTRRYAGIAERSFFFLPTRVSGPDLDRIHGIDERISLKHYGEMIRFYASFMANLSNGAKAPAN